MKRAKSGADQEPAGSGKGSSTGRSQAASGSGKAEAGGGKPGAGGGKAGGGAAGYSQRLAAWLNRHKRYPEPARRLRQQGMVRVSFTLDRNGRVIGQRIVASSGHRALDEEVLAMLRRASPMPKPPPGQDRFTVTVPISFSLR